MVLHHQSPLASVRFHTHLALLPFELIRRTPGRLLQLSLLRLGDLAVPARRLHLALGLLAALEQVLLRHDWHKTDGIDSCSSDTRPTPSLARQAIDRSAAVAAHVSACVSRLFRSAPRRGSPPAATPPLTPDFFTGIDSAMILARSSRCSACRAGRARSRARGTLRAGGGRKGRVRSRERGGEGGVVGRWRGFELGGQDGWRGAHVLLEQEVLAHRWAQEP